MNPNITATNPFTSSFELLLRRVLRQESGMVVRWTVLLWLLFHLAGPLLPPVAAQRYIANPPALPSVPPASEYSVVNAFPGLRFPIATDLIVGMAVPPGRTNEIFLTGQLGRILVVTNLLAPTRTVFLDLTGVIFAPLGGESGLVGLAFHPNYAQNRQFYVYYSRTNREQEKVYITLSRFFTDPTNPYRALPGSEQILFQQHDRDYIHQGGDIQFGPDGYLYVPIGDEGNQNDVYKSSQRIDEGFFSAVHRIDVDGRPGSLVPNPHPTLGSGYWIPPDNPFVGATSFNGKTVDPAKVRTEMWAVGTRNPHRMSFDPATGQAYFGDVGGVQREEVNRLMKGANYGWAHYEGTLFNPYAHIGAPPPSFSYTPPIYQYSRSGGNPNLQGSAVIGGVVYRGTNYPSLRGKYLFGDYIAAHLWAMTFQTSGPPTVTKIATADVGAAGFGIHPGTGELLLIQRIGERVSKLVRNTGSGPNLPATLSQTGVFPDLANLNPRPEVAPYDVASPFWSDNAIKRRWFFFQDATSKVQRSASDQWTFPTGMVWVKHFDIETVRGNPATRRRLETRFIVKTSNAAYGITYRWRSDGSDADLVADEGDDEDLLIDDGGTIRAQRWHYPSRSECMVCHNAGAGFVLGFSTRQLNRDVVRQGNTLNQLVHISNLGALNPVITSPASLPRLVAMDDTSAPLEHRFKSYLDANCAYCHMPGNIGRGSWDARFSVPLGASGIINGPVTDDLGIASARIFKPGDINASIMYQRVSDMGLYHMPPLATDVLNQTGIDLIRNFALNGSYVISRQIFYNGSDFDGRDLAANSQDDRAIALGKQVLFAGGRATIDHVTTYSRGFNGLLVDIWKLPADPTPADIRVRVGNDNNPAGWAAGPAPSAIAVRRGAGVNGSDRVTLIWPDSALMRRWTEVSVMPSARTGLWAPDTFYVGSAPGDTADSSTSAGVDAADMMRVRANSRSLLNPATITSPFDVNRDRRVDSLDLNVIRMNETQGGAVLPMIDLSPAP